MIHLKWAHCTNAAPIPKKRRQSGHNAKDSMVALVLQPDASVPLFALTLSGTVYAGGRPKRLAALAKMPGAHASHVRQAA